MTREAFIAAVIGHKETLYRVSYGLLPNAYDQDDAVQEAIKIALTKWHTLRDEAALKPWLTRILINECYAILRKRKREVPSEEILIETPPDGDTEIIEALMLLDPKHRLPLILNYIEGYTVREIAKMLRLPESTVKSRMKRARTLLRTSMEEEKGGH